MPYCRGCGRLIIFVKTPAGKSMPCDPSLVPYTPIQSSKGRVVNLQGEVIACDLEAPTYPAEFGYIPHWATCPAADRFKKARPRVEQKRTKS